MSIIKKDIDEDITDISDVIRRTTKRDVDELIAKEQDLLNINKYFFQLHNRSITSETLFLLLMLAKKKFNIDGNLNEKY